MKKQFYSLLLVLIFLSAAVHAQEAIIKQFNFKVDSGFSATWDNEEVGMDGQNGFITWAGDTCTTPWISWEQGGNLKIGHKVVDTTNGPSYLVFPSVSTEGFERLRLSVYTASPNQFMNSGYKFYMSTVASPGTKGNFDMGEWTEFSDSLYGHSGSTSYRFEVPGGFEDQGSVTLMCVFNADSSDIDAQKWIQLWSFTLWGLPSVDVEVAKNFSFKVDSGFSATWDQPDVGIDGQNGFITWSGDPQITPWLSWDQGGNLKIGHMVTDDSHGKSYLVFPAIPTTGFLNLRLDVFTASPNQFLNSGYTFYASSSASPGTKENLDMGEWTRFPDSLYNHSGSTTYTLPFPAGFEDISNVSLMCVFNADSNEIDAQKWIQLWSFTVKGVATTPTPKYNVTFGVVSGITPVEGAQINIAGKNVLTDDQGMAIVELEDGKYGYTVIAEGYENYADTVIVEGADQQVGVVLVELDPCVQFYEFRTDLDYCDVPFSDQTWDNPAGIDGECGYSTWLVDSANDLRPWQSWGMTLPQIKIGNYFNSGTAEVAGATGKSILVFPPRSTVGCENLKFEFTILGDDLPDDPPMEHYAHTFFVSKEEDPGIKENLNMNEWVQIGDPINNVKPGDEFSFIIPESFNNQQFVRFMAILEIEEPELKGQWHWIQWNQFTLEGTTAVGDKVEEVDAVSIKLYPIPASKMLMIQGLRSRTEIEVYNLLGNRVLHRFVDGGEATLNIESLSRGMYILRFQGDHQNGTARFMKQ